MAISAGQVFVDLGARLDRREFEAYERQLKKVQERTAKREHFKAELGANFDSRAFNAYERELKKADHANDNMIRSNGRLRTSFGNVWSRGGAAFAAAGGAFAVVTAVKSVTKAYGESQVSQEKMAAQLKAVGIHYDAHAKQIDDVIQKTSKLAGLDDEDLQDAFTAIVRSTKSVNTGLKDMSLVADIARAKHMDVAKAGEFLAKIHAGNVGGLRRLGIEFTKSTDHVDKLKASTKNYTPEQLAAAKAQDKASDSTRALGKLQERFKGQAEAYGKTQAGSMDRVKVAFENLQEIAGKRLGPALTRAANGLANFINEMGSGEGKGGRFVDVLQAIGRGFTIFARTVRTVAGGVAGFFELFMKGIEAVGRAGSHLPGVGDKFRKMADDAHEAGRKLDEFRKRMNISVEAGKVNDKLESMRKKTGTSIGDMHTTVVDGMRLIRRRLGLDSDEGQKAVHRHFRSMVARIREAMHDGKVSTDAGMAEIRRIMFLELKELGISSAQAKGKPLASSPPKGGKVPVVKAGGGWIGAPGTIGHDTIPAMLAPGEAVLNRHQQAVIEGMLGEGFLDRLFATVDKPHYLARGGRIRMAVGGVTPAISSLIEELDSKGFRHGSTTGPGHDPGGFHPRGMAVDYGDASNDMQRLWSVVFPQRRRFAELFGPTRVNPGPHLMHNGAGFQNAALQADHQDHIHMALAAAIGALGSGAASALGVAWKALKAPQTTLTGLLGDVVQGTLNRTTSLANQRGRALARTAAGPDLSGGPGGGSNSANKALGRQMAAAMGWTGAEFDALDRLWTGESGWSNTARNPSSGAFGIPQALPPGKMGPAAAGGNARAQIAWGLNYIKERYGSPSGAYSAWLSRSPHWYAKGGKAGVGHERAWLNRSWAQVAPLFGLPGDSKLGSLFKHIRLSKDNLFVGVSSNPGAKGHETDELLWPRWLWQGSKNQKALDNRSKLQLFIHEMAHRFQSHEATPSEWETEGGAEAFARIAMDRQFGGRRSSKGDPYNAFVTRVVKRHGMDWITGTQFGRARGGFVPGYALGGRTIVPGDAGPEYVGDLIPGYGSLPRSRAQYNRLIRAAKAGKQWVRRWARSMRQQYGDHWDKPEWLYGMHGHPPRHPRGAAQPTFEIGGFAHFAKGGRAGSKLNKTVGGASAGLIRKIRPLQTDRSSQFEALMARVDSADQNYSRWERRFNITDEELVDADTGQVNVGAVQRKAKELGQLILIRAGMERDLEMARDVAKRIVASYRKVVTALRNSLRHSKKKNRKGIQSYINQYQPRITEWQGKLDEVGGSLFDATTDKLELRAELRDVLGTAPELRDTTTDTGADTGVDTTGPDTTTDTTTAPPTPLQIAEGVAAEMRTFLSGRQDLLQSFGRNYLTPGGAGAYFSGRDALDASAGARFFGGSAGGGSLGGLSGGSTVIANFASPPDNAPTFVQQMRFLVENGSSG